MYDLIAYYEFIIVSVWMSKSNLTLSNKVYEPNVTETFIAKIQNIPYYTLYAWYYE